MRDLTVTAVVPTLDEEAQMDALLASLAGFDAVVVADGGSSDATVARARAAGALVVTAAGGRAAQCNAGAAAVAGDVLAFVHADSRLPPGAAAAIRRASANPAVVGGNFALRFDGGDRFAAVLGTVYALQRRLGRYYGDSSIWCRRDAFAALGGFRALAIMDDHDFARRLERHGRTVCLPGPATTSDRRWRRLGIPRTLLAWTVIRWLYAAGVPPDRLAGLYRAVR